MEEFLRKYSFQIHGVGIAVFLLLAVSYYFSNTEPKSAEGTLNLLRLLSMLLATVAAFWTFRYSLMHTDTRENRSRLAIGLTFWSLAQLIWYFFPGVLKYRGTFLNIADILWIAGCFLLLRVLVHQDDLDARKKNLSAITSIAVALIVLAAVPLFISLPALFKMDGAHISGYLPRFAYMGLTLALMVFAGFSLSFKNRGFSGSSWNFISIGFIFWGMAAFAEYALAWIGSPGGKLVLIPDIIFCGFNLLLAADIYLSWIFEQQTGLGTKLKLGFIGKDREIPQFLLHTDVKGNIIFISNNFLQFTNNSLAERYIGKSLREVLGLTEQEFDRLTETCMRGAFIVQQDIKVSAGQKAPVPLFMTVVGSITGNEYFGMDIILHLPNYSGQAYPLDPESSAIAQRILNRTGQHSRENGALLAEYFIAQIQAYKELLNSTQGAHAAAAMDRDVNNAAEKNKWPIRLSGLELNIEPGFDNFDNAELIKAMPILFNIAREYTSNLSGIEQVAKQTALVNKSLSDKILQVARQFGLR